MITETPDEWWMSHGYHAGKEIGDGLWICLAPMIFTYRLMVCDPTSVYNFYCYPREDFAYAMRAWDEWDGKSDPLPGWTRRHP